MIAIEKQSVNQFLGNLNSILDALVIIVYWSLKFNLSKIIWCSGYHICLTHRRSQVRALVWSFFKKVIFLKKINVKKDWSYQGSNLGPSVC